jgi:HAD superfamily hydrolase (TIGR01549 family)
MIKQPIRAVLLDVDGTLYHQGPLRCFMGLELCVLPLSVRSYRLAYDIWRSLRCFRHVREALRHLGESEDALATLQYVEAAKQVGEDRAQIESVVIEWIHQRPLKYLRLCRRRGIEAFLTFLESKGIQVGVFSDYPALDKLQALGLAERVSLVLSATDPAINAFKPHPKGFLHACALWGLPPAEVLYIGDRPEVDAVGAANAGMPCALLGEGAYRRGSSKPSTHYSAFSSFIRLQHALASHC